jgi:hypothetical protein
LEALGDRLFEGMEAIYCFQDNLWKKAEYYLRYEQLGKDGVFWAVMVELLIDRSMRIIRPPGGDKKKTDQWMQPPGTVKIANIWLHGRTAPQMEDSCDCSLRWQPEAECDPTSAYVLRGLGELANPHPMSLEHQAQDFKASLKTNIVLDVAEDEQEEEPYRVVLWQCPVDNDSEGGECPFCVQSVDHFGMTAEAIFTLISKHLA